jgi:hypothetical protein
MNIAMDAKAYATVIKDICVQLRISIPDTNLIRNVTQYCKQLNYDQLKSIYPVDVDLYEFIAESYITSLTAQTKSFDYTQYMRDKAQVSKPTSTDIVSANNIVRPLTSWIGEQMPIISSKSMSVYVDSRMRDVSNDRDRAPITDFTFTLVPRQTRVGIGNGQIQTRIMPSQITFFKVGRIVVPYPLTLRSRNYSNEITLTFIALRSNGIIGSSDTYHFSFTYEPLASNDNLVLLTPVNDYCKFCPPLRLVDDLSIRFNDPILPLAFAVDRLRPTQFNYVSSDGRIVFDFQHGLSTGDVIIVTGLVAIEDNVELLAKINDPRGLVVTKIDDQMISTGINFSALKSPDMSSLPWIHVYSRTFRFPLEIGYQDVAELDV